MQSGILQRIKQSLNWLKQLNGRKDFSKGGKGTVKGYKKIGIADQHGQIQEKTVEEVGVVSKTVLKIVRQCSSSNRNVLHVCCSNPTYTEKDGQVDALSSLQDKGKVLPTTVHPM